MDNEGEFFSAALRKILNFIVKSVKRNLKSSFIASVNFQLSIESVFVLYKWPIINLLSNVLFCGCNPPNQYSNQNFI